MSIAAQLAPTIHRRAVIGVGVAGSVMAQGLDNTVPRRTGATARSQKSRLHVGARVVAFEIEYVSPIANITNEGPRAHVIRARRVSMLRFVVGGRVLYRRQVNWRPGPGVAKNKGWFQRGVTPAKWAAALRRVFG